MLTHRIIKNDNILLNYCNNRPFSADVTSCSLINQQCWIARIFSRNVLYDEIRWYLKSDHNSLLGTGDISQRILSISHREGTRGGNFNGRNPMVRNSGTQQAIVIRYHLSTSYSTFWEKIRAIQHCWLISEQEVTGSDIRRKMVY